MSKSFSKFSVSVLLIWSAAQAQVAVTTYHNDRGLTGANLSETILTTSNVNAATFGKLFSRVVDGQIYAQPLYVSNVNIPGRGVHNVIYICTEHDSVYAFDADSPSASTPFWQVNFGPSFPSSDLSYPVRPETGITSTPVIDLTSNTLYLVAESYENSQAVYRLHAVDITTGNEKVVTGGVVIQGSVSGTGIDSVSGTVIFNPSMHIQRAGLALSGGNVYFAFASHDDVPPYHGWVFGYSTTTLQQTGILCTTPNGSAGGIWHSGVGISVDSNGYLYVVTGNGTMDANTGQPDYGDSVLKISTTFGLTVADYFSPWNQSDLSGEDADFGTTGFLLIPGTSLGVLGTKSGFMYMANQNNLGHYNNPTDVIAQEWKPASSISYYEGFVYYNSTLYTWSIMDGLRAFYFNGTNFNTAPLSGNVNVPAPNEGGGYGADSPAMSISANGTTPGTGILWATYASNCSSSGSPQPGILRAFDAVNIGTELWNSTQNQARDDLGSWGKWIPPTVANGKVYAATMNGVVNVYGLLPTGVLTAAASNSSGPVNLTTEGVADWVHWGDGMLTRKAGVIAQLSDYSVVGVGSATTYSTDSRIVSWSDGTPTLSNSADANGLKINGIGQGFSISAPADTTSRTLIVHVGGADSGGTLTAHLSDGSAADYSDTAPVMSGPYDRTYTLTYHAGTSAQTLIVTWVMASGTGSVTLSAAALPGAGVSAMAGTPQNTTVGTAFGTTLQAMVSDAGGNPVSGVTVTFTAPSSGASAAFASSTTATAITNSSGVATAPILTANAQTGAYVVTASASGLNSTATFNLSNTAGAPAILTASAGTLQTTGVGVNFATALQATVTDAGGNPISGATVVFTAPSTGASASFTSLLTASAVTNASGQAFAPALTANSTPGAYAITATVAGIVSSANFSLTNIGPPANIAATAGAVESTKVNTGFSTALQATVTDSAGDPISGLTVTFTAPSSGSTGTFGASATTTAVTNTNGQATAPQLTANSAAGNYTVTASVAGLVPVASFTLTNNPGSASAIAATTGTPQSATIGAAFATALQATVKDASNNPISGATVVFTAPSTGASALFGSSSTVSVVTNASGQATAPALTANGMTGTYAVTAAVAGVAQPASFNLTNNAIVVTGSITGTAANSAAPVNLTAEGSADWEHWGDASLNRKTGVSPQLSSYTLVGTGSATTYTNDTRPASWSDGTPTVTGSANTNGISITGAGQGFSFTAPADTTPRTLIVHLGGSDSSGTLTAHLSDGSAADFTDTSNLFSGPYDRNYTLSYQSASAGQTLTVTWTMLSGTGGVTLSAASLAASSIAAAAGTPQSATVNAGFATALQATVTDPSGNPLSGVPVIFTLPASGASGLFAGSLLSAATVTNSNGQATAPVLTANGIAGNYTVTANVTGMAGAAVFNLTNNTGAPANISAASGTPQSASIGGAFATPLQVTVTDSSANPISGVTVTFTAPSTGAAAVFGVSSTATATTNSAGQATAPALTANNTAGSYAIVASVSGVAATATFNLTNNAGSPTAITATAGTPQSAVAGAAFITALQATVTDGSGNPVSGVTVTFTAPSTGASAAFGASAIATAVTNASGQATAPVLTANTTAGSYTIVASVSGLAGTASFGLTNNAGAAASIAASAGTPQNTAIGTPFSTALQVTVTDASNNPISGATVTFTAPATGASAAFTSGATATAVTNASGLASAPPLTANNIAGAYNITAKVAGLAATATFNLTNNPGAPANVVPSLGTPQSTVVGTAFWSALQATVTDASGNPVSGVTVTFTAPTTGAGATFASGSTAAVVTNAAGKASVTPLTANMQTGSYAIVASVTGVAATASFNLTNTAIGVSGTLSGAGTSAPAPVSLTTEGAEDWIHWGDAVLNRKSGVSAQLSSYTVIGTGTAATYATDPRPISWTDGAPSAASFNNTNGISTTGTGQGFSLTAPADNTVRTLTLHVGGTDSGATLTAHLSDGSAADFSDTTSTTSGTYDRNYTLTYQAASPGQLLTVSWVLTSGAGNVTASAASLSAISVAPTAGTPQSTTISTAFTTGLQVTVTDALGNPINGATVTFTTPPSGASALFGSLTTATAVTNSSGQAIAPALTANTTAGTYTVTATVAGFATAATFSLTNTAGQPANVAASAGTPQSTAINMPFSTPLQATVTDASGNPVSGATVTFTASATGAGALFGSSTTATAVTNASGQASSPALTANNTMGAYTVTASVTGAASATFNLTNTAGIPASITATAGTPQSATIDTAFASLLQATVKDVLGNPISGVTVTFTAPALGPSATFSGSATTNAVTNSAGQATAAALTANDSAGSYTVVASVSGLAATASFSLTNTAIVGSTDIALGKTATQSSTLSGFGATSVASSAVDGNTDGNFYDGSVSHTNFETNAWWQVDLGSPSNISSITIWNRTDCCVDRLSDYWVFVSTTPFNASDTPATLQSRAATWSSHQTSYPNPSTTIPVNALGRYVRVQLTGTNYLNLAEVQIFGAVSTASTYGISGQVTISGAALNGVNMALTGPENGSATTSGSGAFNFQDLLAGGTYTVTPTLAGFSFTPSSQTVNNLTANQVLNFTASATGGNDLALGRTATQSSTYPGLGLATAASSAVDGNTDGNFADGSVSHTNDEVSPWWQVDLGAPASITSIAIWNRTDCCSDRLSDYWVFVSNTPFLPTDTPLTLQSRAATWNIHQTTFPNPVSSIPVNANGQYVRVQLTGANYLNLAEVQVFGTSSAPITYTISGQATLSGAGLSGVTMGLSGSQTGSYTTQASGNYSFIGLTANNTYTVTPSLGGYTFTPPSLTFTNISANQTANFVATPVTYGITGQVTASGLPLSGVSMNLTGGQTGIATTNASGSYTFSGLSNAGYTVTPTLTGYSFTPPSQTIAFLSSNQVVNFTATVITGTNLALGKTATESSTLGGFGPGSVASSAVDGNTDGDFFDGSVSHTNFETMPWWQVDLGTPGSINTIVVWNRTDCCLDRLSDYWVFVSNTPFGPGDTPATLATRAGTWSVHQTSYPNPSTTIAVNAQGRYVRVQLSGTNYLNLAEVQVYGISTPPVTYAISGQVTSSGTPLNGVTMTLAGSQTGTANTIAGSYSFAALLSGGSYTITPSLNGYNFAPPSQTISSLTSNQTLNFIATPITYGIAGQVSISGVALAAVNMTVSGAHNGSVLTNSSGTYSFTGLQAAGNYTVTPTLAGYTFIPPSQTFTNLVSNQTANFIAVSIGSGDLAVGKTATQSSTLLGFGPDGPSNAIDGNTDGNFADASVSHTGFETNPWWQVDLGSSSTISSITIWNRTDCCSDRMTDYWVFVSNTPFASTDTPLTLQSRPGTWNNHQPGYPNPSTTVLVNTQGRYVRIQLSGTNYLSLAEVQVFGSTSAPVTYSISGQVTAAGSGLNGVTLTVTGSQSTSGISSGTGAYTLTGLPAAGTYTVTPVLSGYTFTPPAQTFTNLSANQTVNFTATPVSGNNLALGQPATQSSTLAGFGPTSVASSAVDGNTDGNFFDGSVAHTNAENNPWWQVDLGTSVSISSVAIWNRTDCCVDRLSDYWVFVSNTPFAPTDTPSTLSSRAGTWSSHQIGYPNPSTVIPVNTTGRYVRVQLSGFNYLNLAEVQVFGH